MSLDDRWGDVKFPPKIIVPLLPLRDLVFFPHHVSTLFVGRTRSIASVEEAVGDRKLIVLAAQKKPGQDDPTEEDIFRVGTLCRILQVLRYPNETVRIQVQGIARAKVLKFRSSKEFYSVEAEVVHEPLVDQVREEALSRSLLSSFEQYLKANRKLSPEVIDDLKKIKRIQVLSDTVASFLTTSKLTQKQALLEEKDPAVRTERLIELLALEVEILIMQRRIQTRIKRQMDKDQKEYYLGLQKQAISRELGETDEFQAETKELEGRIANKLLSQEARTKCEREIKKLKMMSPLSSEATVIRNYLEWIVSLPWGEVSNEEVSLERAKQILDEDHYGLEKIKERIIEYIAVGKLVEKVKGPILCLVGPPGVGKTSLGASIARACGKKFVRISLGGVRDEAEIRGHRRTYIGAYPGKIIYGMKKAGVMNPVFLLDEIDKMTVDYRGDPAAALLEVLDPEQNKSFVDHFLDVEYDLSNVMFIATANTVRGIPFPLLDRMEVLELHGYTEYEKEMIARKFLLPKQMRACGIQDVNLVITAGAMRSLIQRYTKEAGVRNLEREIAAICRKIACQVLEKKQTAAPLPPFRITTGVLGRFLGAPQYRVGTREKVDEVGLCTGLAFTQYGGDILQVEVSVVPGKGKVQLTGKLGEVMQESAQAAVSYLRKKAAELRIDPLFYQKKDIHVHMPEGAVPKDGPSAGITIATALASALMGVPVKRKVALTGEITLRGKVLGVGGIKEKLIAAARGRISTVIIPAENRKSLKEVPKSVLRRLTIVMVQHMDEVLREALVMEDIEKLFPARGTVIEAEKNAPSPSADGGNAVLPTFEVPPEGDVIRL